MKICLSHTTALIWLMRNVLPCGNAGRRGLSEPLGLCAPDMATTQRLLLALDLGVDKLDALVTRPGDRKGSAQLRCHVIGRVPLAVAAEVVLEIPSPIEGVELYVTSPELTLLHLCKGAPLLDTIYYGMALCSNYQLDARRQSGVRVRPAGQELTNMQRLQDFLTMVAGETGTAQLRRALPYIREHARSPREAGFAMLFGLPSHLGGFHLGDVTLNPPISISVPSGATKTTRRQERIPDLVITAPGRNRVLRRVGFDYDGDSEHADGRHSHARDTKRRNDLATVNDLPCFALTTLQANDFNEVTRVAEQMRRALKQRRMPRTRVGATPEEKERQEADVYHMRMLVWQRYVLRRRH